MVSKCSNTVSPQDGVAYTETCWELYETRYTVFLVYKLVKIIKILLHRCFEALTPGQSYQNYHNKKGCFLVIPAVTGESRERTNERHEEKNHK
jgi:hypothetical protein